MGIVTARDQVRELRALADQFGVGLEMENTHKGHIRAIFRAGDQQSALIMARGHGGDVRARKNNISRVRRQLRELTGRSAP